MITITHKYILINTSDRTLQCGQRGTSTIWQLLPETRAPFHWPDAGQPLELCLRPGTGWRWSGAFKACPADCCNAPADDISTVCQSPHDKLWSNPRQACSLLCKRWSEQLTKVEMVQIGIAGAFGVRTSNMATKEHHILPVSISMQGASCIVSLGSLHIEPPPYRIVNR